MHRLSFKLFRPYSSVANGVGGLKSWGMQEVAIFRQKAANLRQKRYVFTIVIFLHSQIRDFQPQSLYYWKILFKKTFPTV